MSEKGTSTILYTSTTVSNKWMQINKEILYIWIKVLDNKLGNFLTLP
jgi:hypothetical protein